MKLTLLPVVPLIVAGTACKSRNAVTIDIARVCAAENEKFTRDLVKSAVTNSL